MRLFSSGKINVVETKAINNVEELMPLEIPILVKLLKSDDMRLRMSSIYHFSRIKNCFEKYAAPYLFESFFDNESDVRKFVVEKLHEIGLVDLIELRNNELVISSKENHRENVWSTKWILENFLTDFVINCKSPEIVGALLRKAFDVSVRNKGFVIKSIKEALFELKSEVSPEVICMALSAAGYELKMSDKGYEIDLSESEKSIMYLCEHNCQATSNILHLVAQKKDISTSVSFYCGDSFETYECKESCESQRVIALKELGKRGNPPYELKAYFRT